MSLHQTSQSLLDVLRAAGRGLLAPATRPVSSVVAAQIARSARLSAGAGRGRRASGSLSGRRPASAGVSPQPAARGIPLVAGDDPVELPTRLPEMTAPARRRFLRCDRRVPVTGQRIEPANRERTRSVHPASRRAVRGSGVPRQSEPGPFSPRGPRRRSGRARRRVAGCDAQGVYVAKSRVLSRVRQMDAGLIDSPK